MDAPDEPGLSAEIWTMPVKIPEGFRSIPIDNMSPLTVIKHRGYGWRWRR